MPKITVRLNGTDSNPWHVLHLRCNPFPQIAEFAYIPGMMAINELDGDPLTSTDDIRRILKGKMSEEFIELCCKQYKPGEQVEFIVTFDD